MNRFVVLGLCLVALVQVGKVKPEETDWREAESIQEVRPGRWTKITDPQELRKLEDEYRSDIENYYYQTHPSNPYYTYVLRVFSASTQEVNGKRLFSGFHLICATWSSSLSVLGGI